MILLTICSGCTKIQTLDAVEQAPTKGKKIQFICQKKFDEETKSEVYSTLAINSERERAIILWKKEDFSGHGYPPQKRCEEVSPRFQEAYENGSLTYFTHGAMNQQPVICTATEVGGECRTLLLTLRHQDNGEQTLEQLSNIFQGYASGALEESSGDISFSEDNRPYVEVNIEEFLNQP